MKKLSQFSLKFQITFIMMFVISVFTIVFLLSASRSNSIGHQISESAVGLQKLQGVMELVGQINQSAQFLVLNSSAGNATDDEKKKASSMIREVAATIESKIATMQNQPLTDAFATYKAEISKVVTLLESGDSLTAAEVSLKSLPNHYNAVRAIGEKELQETVGGFESKISGLRSLNNWVLFVIAITVVAAIAACLFGTSQILRPIYESNSILEGTASDVASAAQISREDSERIRKSATDLSINIEEITVAMEELRSMVNKNVRSAEESMQVTDSTAQATSSCQKTVTELRNSMGSIDSTVSDFIHAVDESMGKIESIVTSIRDIADRTKVINDIVFQTKLLSFNASVEAARAGEHGKGFAVVAEEVGNLSSMSGQAAKEISDLVQEGVRVAQDVTSEVKERINSLAAIVQASVKDGNSLVESTVDALNQVAHNMGDLRTSMDQINQASQEQADGLDKVNQSVTHLSRISTGNSSLAQNFEDSSNRLGERSESLQVVVQKIDHVLVGNRSDSRHAA